jgi:alpha-L-fucosidase 2
MLLQSAGGVVRVFPATSQRWPTASFQDLRAEGGFQVSATREGGRTVHLTIRATALATLTLRDPFAGAAVTWSRRGVRRVGQNYVVRLHAGEALSARRLTP